ncbi:hypothetical protein PybrP1_004363 [[Pythium] brassicae (nom. inval.)]|nr:hypothetical protein PybrP1_004363 [[Pythium] brassicae (nom. inval.)]
MRTNGLEKPFSKDQVVSWVLQPLLMSCFVAFVAKLLDRDKCLAILVPNAALVLIVLASWAICETRNSAEPKASAGCFRVPAKATRYCSICCKSSPGLDHHCTWLNTCIGENNYEAFYCLVVAATLQTLGQALVGVLVATLWFGDASARLSAEWREPVRALLWVHNALCLSLANSYLLLAGFHTYLLCVGSGTYDFILANGNDGLCARLLKCRCLQRAKKVATKKTGSKLSHVVDADSMVKQVQCGPSIGAEDALRSAAAAAANDKKQQEIAQWKAEWLQKYGADSEGDDAQASSGRAASSTGFVPVTPPAAHAAAGPPVVVAGAVASGPTAPASTAKVAAEASTEPGRAHRAGDGKVNARRTSTYPAELFDGAGGPAVAAVGESQVSMSIRVNRSEDIFEDVELVEGADRHSGDNAASSGRTTDL